MMHVLEQLVDEALENAENIGVCPGFRLRDSVSKVDVADVEDGKFVNIATDAIGDEFLNRFFFIRQGHRVFLADGWQRNRFIRNADFVQNRTR